MHLLPPVRRALRLYAGIDARIDRAQEATRGFVGGLLGAALHPAEQSALTVSTYDRGGQFDGRLEWETALLESLPAGRVLVGGAGNGREVAQLRALGHTTDALEPAAAPAAICRGRIDADGLLVVCDYAALTDAVLDGEPTAAHPLLDRSYAAVLLGWGSLTHVLEPAARCRLLQACDRLCPRGPIVGSAWIEGTRFAPDARPPEALGRRVGSLVGRLRRVPVPEDRLIFNRATGFGAALSPDALRALGDAIGRETRLDPDGVAPTVVWPPR
jgi:hypothetical protein